MDLIYNSLTAMLPNHRIEYKGPLPNAAHIKRLVAGYTGAANLQNIANYLLTQNRYNTNIIIATSNSIINNVYSIDIANRQTISN